jgi:hypothetical protein
MLAKQILAEEQYTRSYLLESISINEKGHNEKVDPVILQELLSLNLEPETENEVPVLTES